MSFPVAAFVSVTLLLISMSSGTLASTVASGTIAGVDEETGATSGSVLDVVLLPLFKAMLQVFNLVEGFSPIDALSTGRSVSWGMVGLAFAQIVLLLGGLVALFGIWMFNRRELAAGNTHS